MAKFKVGDKVRHVDDGQDGPVGVVKGVYGDGKIKVKFPGLMKDGFDGFEEEELVMANGCARNAKFKVGDKIKVKGAGVETIKAVYPKGKGSGLDPTQVDMSVDWYETDGSGVISDEDIAGVANSASVRSANAVVQNAINARRARNAGDLSAPFQAALSAVRKLAEEAKKINPDHEVYKDAVKAGTALLRVKPKW